MRLACLLSFLSVLFSNAQPVLPGAEAAALGGTYVTQSAVFSSRHNVAGLAFLNQNAIAIGARNNYLVSGLYDFYLATALVRTKGTLAFDASYYGIAAYQEGRVGMCYSLRLSANWSAGLRVAYAYNYIPQEQVNRQAIAADAGLLGLIGKWRIGAALKNFVQSGWQGRVNEREPVGLVFGGGYYFLPATSVTAEYALFENTPGDVRVGLSYSPADALTLRFGFSTRQPAVSFGLGLQWHMLQINLTANWHRQLGLSPLTDVVYAW